MSIPRYQARQVHLADWDVIDLADDGKAVLCCVPEAIVINVTEALNAAYESGVADGTASERIAAAGRTAAPRQFPPL